MNITENDARQIIRSAYELIGTPGKKISIEGAHKIANWLYNQIGWAVTTLYVERIWNEIASEEKQS